MKDRPEKPQGASGRISVNGSGAKWEITKFPASKAERETLIATLFVKAFDHYVANQSEPSLAPFGEPKQNNEADLDFTVDTADGARLMELVEFAPLKEHGPKFADAPAAIDPNDKAPLVYDLIKGKSDHQGGPGRFLVIYATEYGFKLDPITIEKIRRLFSADAPNFERVYYLSIHDAESGSVTEIFPGKPHVTFGKYSDEDLERIEIFQPHPKEWAPFVQPSEDAEGPV